MQSSHSHKQLGMFPGLCDRKDKIISRRECAQDINPRGDPSSLLPDAQATLVISEDNIPHSLI